MTGRQTSARSRRMIRSRRRLSDDEARTALQEQLKTAYAAGASIRELAAAHRLAFGTVRTLLLEAGVVLRSRGGPNHTRRKAAGRGDTPTRKGS